MQPDREVHASGLDVIYRERRASTACRSVGKWIDRKGGKERRREGDKKNIQAALSLSLSLLLLPLNVKVHSWMTQQEDGHIYLYGREISITKLPLCLVSINLRQVCRRICIIAECSSCVILHSWINHPSRLPEVKFQVLNQFDAQRQMNYLWTETNESSPPYPFCQGRDIVRSLHCDHPGLSPECLQPFTLGRQREKETEEFRRRLRRGREKRNGWDEKEGFDLGLSKEASCTGTISDIFWVTLIGILILHEVKAPLTSISLS